MSRSATFGASALVLLLAVVAWRIIESSNSTEVPFQARTNPIDAAPLCPWREPDTDLQRFFPDATRYEAETRILSGLRLELAGRLGRTPAAEENALHLYRVFREREPLGTILVRRVKGEHGAIEIVLAVAESGQIAGVRLQRLREPDAIAAGLEQPEWLAGFRGKTVKDFPAPGRDLPAVPAEARVSAQAVVEGVRSLLVLLDAASKSGIIIRSYH